MRERIRYDLVTAIARARGRLGLTQAELARRLGIPASQISRFERGGDPRISTVLDIAGALGLELVAVPKSRLSAVKAVLAEDSDERQRPRFA